MKIPDIRPKKGYLPKTYVEKSTKQEIIEHLRNEYYLWNKNNESFITCGAEIEALMEEMYTTGILEGEKKEKADWVRGGRCYVCGDHMTPSRTTDTCSKCWEEI